MKPPSRSGNMLRGQLQEANQKRKPTMKTKRARFDTLVARYYPAVYSFASRLTDDPRKAVLLTYDAFNSTRQQLESRPITNPTGSRLRPYVDNRSEKPCISVRSCTRSRQSKEAEPFCRRATARAAETGKEQL